MQSRNQIFDDLTRLITNALGLAQDASGEIENALKNVTIQEFEASQFMLNKAINEITKLRNDLEKVQKLSKTTGSRSGAKGSS